MSFGSRHGAVLSRLTELLLDSRALATAMSRSGALFFEAYNGDMPALVECVPNFSEGRDRFKLERIAAAIRGVAGVHLLDLDMDPDHNRSVITFVGPPANVEQAAACAVGEAAALIDLNRHRGEHPRIGAADVVPIAPLEGVTLSDCVPMAHRLGKEIWSRFQIPVYFYEAAALRPDRRNLESIRRGGYEKLRDLVATDPSRRPDVGGPHLHPTAGATAVGARKLLIAFNVNLNTADLNTARTIARAVRSAGEGLTALKAIGVLLSSRTLGGRPGQAQVAMNLTDWEQTSLAQAFRAVEREASRLGVAIESSELVGLVPARAMEGITPESLRLRSLGPEKILENRLVEAFRDN